MKHAVLLELRLRHLFYTDGRCPDLAITPAHGTARLLEKHRCLLRSSPGLVRVVTPLDDTESPLLPLPAGASLFFELRITNGDFALFTDLSDVLGTRSPLFTNAPGATGELDLTRRETVDPETGRRVPVPQAPGVLAEIEIFLHPGDGSGRTLPAAAFQVTFQPRAWRWAYYCVTHLQPGGGELKIEYASTSGAAGGAGAPSFGDRTWIDQENPDTSDPVASRIVARRAGIRCVRFVSDQPVPCREEPRALELRLDTSCVSKLLPNPSVRSFTRRRLPPPTEEPQDLLFHVIDYPAQPSATA